MINLRSKTEICRNKKEVGLYAAAPIGNTFVGARCSMGVVVSVLPTFPGGKYLFSATTKLGKDLPSWGRVSLG